MLRIVVQIALRVMQDPNTVPADAVASVVLALERAGATTGDRFSLREHVGRIRPNDIGDIANALRRAELNNAAPAHDGQTGGAW